MSDRKIKFLSRTLPFPTDPTFREYRVVQELTGVTAEQIMTGTAGVWMLPVLAIVAMLRANPNVTHEQLDRIIDLQPQEIELEGNFTPQEEPNPEVPSPSPTGTESTGETLEQSGTQDLPITSPSPPEDQTT